MKLKYEIQVEKKKGKTFSLSLFKCPTILTLKLKLIFQLFFQIYKQEAIGVDSVNAIDNQPILNLIEQKKPMGILPLLDEECRRPGMKLLSNLGY